MLKHITLGTLAFGMLLGSATIASAGDAPKALTVCKSCHFLDKGAEVKKGNLGQGLKGVFGRKISITGVESLGDTWSEEALNTWLSNPGAVKPGTKMSFKQKNEDKRKEIIAALKEI